MSKSVNQAILLGRLTADPELRSTSNGKQVTSFTLAVDKMANQEGADFFEVTAWDKLAELLRDYTKKGSKILVIGRLSQQTWEDKETGSKRSKIILVANDVTFLDPKNTSENTKNDEIDMSTIPF